MAGFPGRDEWGDSTPVDAKGIIKNRESIDHVPSLAKRNMATVDWCTITGRNPILNTRHAEINWTGRPEVLVTSQMYRMWYKDIWHFEYEPARVYAQYVRLSVWYAGLTSAQPEGTAAGVWVVWAAALSQRMSAPVCQNSVGTAGFPAPTAPTQSPPTTWSRRRNH